MEKNQRLTNDGTFEEIASPQMEMTENREQETINSTMMYYVSHSQQVKEFNPHLRWFKQGGQLSRILSF